VTNCLNMKIGTDQGINSDLQNKSRNKKSFKTMVEEKERKPTKGQPLTTEPGKTQQPKRSKYQRLLTLRKRESMQIMLDEWWRMHGSMEDACMNE